MQGASRLGLPHRLAPVLEHGRRHSFMSVFYCSLPLSHMSISRAADDIVSYIAHNRKFNLIITTATLSSPREVTWLSIDACKDVYIRKKALR